MFKKVSILIPVYNEERTILEVLKEINMLDFSKYDLIKEIIVVDDGSTDKTAEILERNNLFYSKLIKKLNGGKGSAIRAGLKEVSGGIILIQDADLEYPPGNYVSLLGPLLEGKTNVVYGSRFINQNIFSKQKWFLKTHYIGNIFLSFLTSILFFASITDMETGHKCFTKEVLSKLRLKENDFRIEPEITAKILKNKFRILEVPILYAPRNFSEGKKINWKDGLLAFFALIKYRFKD